MSRCLHTTLFSLALALVAPLGCAVSSEGPEDAADSNAALSSDTVGLIGKYFDRAVPQGGIARLTLESNGTYAAEVDANGAVLCVRAPCLLHEAGRWTAQPTARGMSLTLDPESASGRAYDVKQLSGRLELSSVGGKTQQLVRLADNQCLDDSDCAAANLECAPKICAMFCASSDPFCCGPSQCRAKTAQH
jgi:hypothetical protein